MVVFPCPGREQLLAFTLGKLPEESIDAITAHLDRCPACEAMAATLDHASDTLVSRLRAPLPEGQDAQDPQCQEVLAQLKAVGPWQDACGPASGRTPEEGEGLHDEAAPGAPATPPAELGEYVLLERLSGGGMGVVYKARHKNLGRTVALKVIASGREGDDRALARFQREMRAVGRLDHPNIVQAHDAREVGGTWFLVMQYVEGLNLAQLVKRSGPLGIADACGLARQAALGLQVAHEHGMVHRDVKPSNLLLTRLPSPACGRGVGGEGGQPLVKLLDLGLALLRDELALPGDTDADMADVTRDEEVDQPCPAPAAADDLTGAHIVGTCDYMAPEQARDAHAVDIRADIYSLGCTLYKLLTGRAPFEGPEYDTPAAKLAAHAQAPVPAIRQRRADVPEELAAIVGRMLAKDPGERFAAPAEVAEALQPWAADSDLASLLGGLSRFSRSENGTVPFRKALPRHRRRLALAAGGAAAILLLGVILTLSTAKGTVQLEFADAEAARQCTISIDGDEIRLENLGDPIRLWPGKHELRVMHGDLEIETREFTVLRGGAEVLHVSIPGLTKGRVLATAHDHAERARYYADREEWVAAIAAYNEAIRLDPKSAQYYLGRAEAGRLGGGDMPKAIADFTEAIRLDPGRIDARLSLATLHFLHGRTQQAEPDFREALRISPDCVEQAFQKAELCRQKNQPCRAMEEEQKATSLLLAMVAWDEGYLDRAINALRLGVRATRDAASARLHWASCWLPAVVRGKDGLPGVLFVSDMPWVRSSCGWGPSVPKRNNMWARGPVLVGGLPYAKGISTHAFNDLRPADVVVDISAIKVGAFKAHVGVDLGSVQFQVLVDGQLQDETPVMRYGKSRAVFVDVGGAAEVVLRVLNGGDGNEGDGAIWGLARFVEAGGEDPLEEPPQELRSATEANAALLLAEVWWRLDGKDVARRWFDKAAQWMDKNQPDDENLRRCRAEAAELLGVPERPSTAKERADSTE